MKTSDKLREIAKRIDEVDKLPLEQRNYKYSELLDELRLVTHVEFMELDLRIGTLDDK